MKLMYKRLLALALFVSLSAPMIVGATYYPAGGGQYRLQTSIGTTNTTIRLSSFKEPVSNTPYTMTYLNSDSECGTIDPQTSRSEFISFTGITQNSDGTAVLTGVTRGLARVYPYTASTTQASAHPGQSVFILSDAPCLFNNYAVKQNNESITGSWTTVTPTTASGIATKGYVDGVVSAGTFASDRVAVGGTAGQTIVAGDIVSFNASTGRWFLSDTDNATTTYNAIVGIAQGSGTAGNAISGGVVIQGLDTNQSGLTANTNYFVSSTAGDLQTATSTRLVGKAVNSTSIYVDPYFLGDLAFNGKQLTFPSYTGASSTALVNDGTGVLGWQGYSNLLFASATPMSFTSQASTTLYQATVPANTLGLRNGIRVTMPYVFKNGCAGNSQHWELAYGTGTTSLNWICSIVAPQAYSGTASIIIKGNGATNSQNMFLEIAGTGTTTQAIGNSTTYTDFASASSSVALIGVGTISTDSTASQQLIFRVKLVGGVSLASTSWAMTEVMRE